MQITGFTFEYMTMYGDDAYIVATYTGNDSLKKGIAIYYETDNDDFTFWDIEGPSGYHVNLAKKLSQFLLTTYIMFISGTDSSGNYYHQH